MSDEAAKKPDPRVAKYEKDINAIFKKYKGEERERALQEYRENIISKCAKTSQKTALQCEVKGKKECTSEYLGAGGKWFSYSMPASVRNDITAPDANAKKIANTLANDLVWVCDTFDTIAHPSTAPMATGNTNPGLKKKMQKELQKLLEQEPDGEKRKEILHDYVDKKLCECMEKAANNAVSPEAADFIRAGIKFCACRAPTDDDYVKECDFDAAETAADYAGYIDHNCANAALDSKEA